METVVVVAWEVRPGAAVKAGECLVTVETAKATTEVLAPCDGWLVEIVCEVGQEVPVGAVLGHLSDSAATAEEMTVVAPTAAATPDPPRGAFPAAPSATTPFPGARLIASPLARRTAAAAQIALDGITGTGPHGRIKARDVHAALRNRQDFSATTAGAAVRETELRPHSAAPRSAGTTDPILLLHGFGADRTTWRQVIPVLRAQLPGTDIIALDLPGHGRETSMAAVSLEEIVFHLADRVAAIGLEEAHLVGHSLGGAAAIALTSIGRLAVRSLTLIAPGGSDRKSMMAS
ncbi:alpha/beta fold hydrolase [Segnochrobactrum spirostomi]|nr:alpha/beta fold hydrolase [Segnochrobactrum spirostomi]